MINAKEKKEGDNIAWLTWNQLRDEYNFGQTCSSQKALSLLYGVLQRQKAPVKNQSDFLAWYFKNYSKIKWAKMQDDVKISKIKESVCNETVSLAKHILILKLTFTSKNMRSNKAVIFDNTISSALGSPLLITWNMVAYKRKWN